MSACASPDLPNPSARKRGRPPLPVVLHPDPQWPDDDDPEDFHEALAGQMKRHGDTAHSLHRAVKSQGGLTDRKTLSEWWRGMKSPQTPASLKVIDLIELRYRLAPGRLRGKLRSHRATKGQAPTGVGPAEARRLAWHLPDDFRQRSAKERAEILAWVRTRILTGGTAYSLYHSKAARHRFALRFDEASVPTREGRQTGSANLAAPPQLQAEMRSLIQFKSVTLTDLGFQRSGVFSLWRGLARLLTAAAPRRAGRLRLGC